MTREEADKLDAIAATLGELSVAFKTHDAREESCRIRVHEMAIELWGNGKPGLKTRLDRIEQRAALLWGAVCAGAAVLGFLAERAMAFLRE